MKYEVSGSGRERGCEMASLGGFSAIGGWFLV